MFNQKFLHVNKLAKILTQCFHEIINSKNGHDVYYAALVLHPGRILPLCLDIKLISLVLVLIGHIWADILKQPNPLTHTVTISCWASTDSQADSLLVCRKASLCAGGYTFSLLKLLSNSGYYPELKSITKPEITSCFQKQWDAFTVGEYPFLPHL